MSQHIHTPSSSIGKALFVEDDEFYGLDLKLKLERAHVECTWFEEFEPAKEALSKLDFHVLITDMFLKSDKPNGLQLIRLAKEKGIPSVIITCKLDMAIAKAGLNEGADALLEKPFDIRQLVKVLQEIWENPRGMVGRRERYFEMQNLTEKEKEIARLVVKGLTNQEVANVSGTSLATVKFYTNQIFEKCAVHSRAELFNSIFPS